MKDYNGAIVDYTIAIELDPDNAKAYFSRGFAKLHLTFSASADVSLSSQAPCADMKEAARLGHKNAAQWVRDICN